MVERRRKKKNKLRGQRTHGNGNTKNKRGAGCRGGRGRAGSRSHNYVKYLLDGSLDAKGSNENKRIKVINLGMLDQKMDYFVEQNLVEKKGEEFFIDGKKIGFERILGIGKTNKKLVVSNIKVSKKAVSKILQAGGKIEGVEEEINADDFEAAESEELEESDSLETME